jgi:hypothetical protein
MEEKSIFASKVEGWEAASENLAQSLENIANWGATV